MNIYLITRDKEYQVDYDEFVEAVVCASNEKDAAAIHPSGEDVEDGSWVSADKVDVKLIGKAGSNIKRGVISAWFLAG